MKKMILAVSALAFLSGASAALADWNEGDAYKMHYPQLPDPTGLDAYFTNITLADDFQCTESGPITDVHFWWSVLNDDQGIFANALSNVHVSIHANIPASDSVPFSRPGALLWQSDFAATQFTSRLYGQGNEGWYDPGFTPNTYQPNNHFFYYQTNIVNIPNPFYQTAGQIYWLDLSVDTFNTSVRAGWKSSISPQFMDTGVWQTGVDDNGNPIWAPIYDPRFPVLTNLDFAFVITPTPGAASLLGVGVIGLLRRRR